MGLPAGTRLGSFEVLASLGAGGRGEVYRADVHNLAAGLGADEWAIIWVGSDGV